MKAWASDACSALPTVAAMCAPSDADELAAALPSDGHTKVLRIDHEGATIEAPYT